MQQRCPNCGSPIVPGQRFCGGCGAQLTLACPQCRITVSPGTRFCPNCGATLGGGTPQQPGGPPQQPGRVQQPGGPQQPAWGQQPGSSQQPGWGQQSAWSPPAQQGQSLTSSRPFLILLLFVLLIILGTLTFMYTPVGDTIKNMVQSATGGTGTTIVTTKPVISNVKATVGTSVVINWKTDALASSQVEYGETTAYGHVYPAEPANDPTTGQSAGVLEHSVALPNDSLEQEVTYHYRVKSHNAAGETVSSDSTFTTLKPPEE